MSIFSKTTLLIAGAATLAVASPALADRGYGEHRGNGDAAAIVGGLIAVGAIAAIAASSSHHDHDRYRNYNRGGYYGGGYAQPYPSYGYGYSYPQYGYQGRGYGYERHDHDGYRGGDYGRGGYERHDGDGWGRR